jgi:hypothetical protein
MEFAKNAEGAVKVVAVPLAVCKALRLPQRLGIF